MKKIGALLLIVLFLIPFAAADGMMYVQDQDLWTLQSEQQQVAAIQYENGIENLLISINPGENLKGTKGIWIFPVPASPDTITIDVIKGYPYFQGQNIENTYSDTVHQASGMMIGYATFPLSVCAGIPYLFLTAGMMGSMQSDGFSNTPGVSVYESIEKMGVTSELITATDSAAVSHYFEGKGFTAPGPAQSSLDEYIGQDYSFVVVYISNTTAYNLARDEKTGGYSAQNMIGSSVQFPTDRMYFPLKPTRVYGNRQIPVLLYVVGHVTPEIFDDISSGTSVTYYTQNLYQTGEGLEAFFNGKQSIADLEYTKIRIQTPSNDFTDDLWIDEKEPAELAFKKLFIGLYAVFGVVFYLLFSVTASLIAGMLWMRETPVPKRKLLLHGLWNCLTLIGFVYGTGKAFDGEIYRNRRLFVLSFYLIFAVFLSIYTIALDPSALGGMWICWVMAIVAPFALIFLVPAIGIPLFVILCILVWKIYQWLGPEMPPGTGLRHSVVFRLSQLNPYEKRWGTVIGIGVVLFIAGILTNVFIKNGMIGQLGLFVVEFGLFFYSLNIFRTGIQREKIIASILLIIPFIIRGFFTGLSDNITIYLLTAIILCGITYAVLAVAVWIQQAVISRTSGSKPAANELPDLRLIAVLGLICILIFLPQATVLTGLPHPEAVSWTEKGDALAQEGKYFDAMTAYDNAIDIDSDYATAWEHKGDLCLYRGKASSAAYNYMRALNLDRNNEIFHYKYGKALENEGDVSRARNEYQEAILINPNYEEAKEALQNLPG